MPDTLIKAEAVSKKFCRDLRRSLWYGVHDILHELRGHRHTKIPELRDKEFWAVRDVSFQLKRGECLGLVGRNGAGKTTLLRMLSGLLKPDHGRIEMRGRVGALIALGAGFNPVLTGRENIYVNAAVLGIPKKLVAQELDEIVDFAELGEFIDAPVQSYSSGMQVRLGFSIATALKPDILLLDEVLAVGDATFRSKCIKRIGATLNKAAVVFVSHDAWSIRRICDSVILLDRGTTAYQGDTETGMELYAESTEDGGARQPFLNVAPFVTSVVHRAELHRRALRDGGEAIDVDVTISFDSDRTLTPGFCHGNLITLDEMVLGQFDFGPWFPRIERGRNLISFRVVGVQLARGRYTMTVQVYDDTKKEIVLNLRHFILITFSGNMRYGPRYAIATEPIPLAPPSSA